MDNARKINLIALGDSAVGKTSIIKRIKDGKFQEVYEITIGTDFYVLRRKYEKKNIMMELVFCETPGQEIFEPCVPVNYIRDSHIVLLVFSDINTLNELKHRWNKFYKKNINIENSRIILIGNKSDTFGDKRDEIIRLGYQFAEEIDAWLITCSAKTGDNMDNLERDIILEARRFIDREEKEYYISKIKQKNYKRENLKEDNHNYNRIANDDDYNKALLWKNSKLNKYISF